MKVLVTGIDGYIGTVLGQTLLDEGFDVVGLDTGYYRSGWLYNGVKRTPPIITKDVRSVAESDVRGFDAVVHLAELSNDPLGHINEETTLDVNHRGTVHLAEVCKQAGVPRFVYASSCSVYGASDIVSGETSPVNPQTMYARCKVMNEQALMKLSDGNFSPVILRNATVFGPSPRMRFDIAVNNLAGLAWTTKKIAMDTDGTPWRPFIHIQDVSRAVVCALKAPRDRIHNVLLNVGGKDANYQIKDVSESIANVFTDCEITYGPPGMDNRNYRVNFDKIHAILPDFHCQFTVDDGVRELYNLFRKIQLDEQTFISRHYTRLKQIQYLRNTNQIDEKFFWVE